MTGIINHNIGLENQIRTHASLVRNATGNIQPTTMAFVQFDDSYAVGADGCIYQICYDIQDECTLYYQSETGVVFNYAEDKNELTDEEDIEIFNHCLNIAEMM